MFFVHVPSPWGGPGLKARVDSDHAAIFALVFLQMPQATTLGVVGDSIAQRLERRWNPGQRYELKRTLHAGILNMIIGKFRKHHPMFPAARRITTWFRR